MICEMKFKRIQQVLAIGFVFLSLCLPVLIHAQDGNVTAPTNSEKRADEKSIIYICVTGAPGECTFQDVISAVQKLLGWARNFALFFSVIVLVVAGFKYMTSGGNPGKISEANKMFEKVAIGIVVVMSAWLIVTLITNALLEPGISTIIQNNKPN